MRCGVCGLGLGYILSTISGLCSGAGAQCQTLRPNSQRQISIGKACIAVPDTASQFAAAASEELKMSILRGFPLGKQVFRCVAIRSVSSPRA
jgi:CxxC motif-containing protein (DUF1111 family)